MSIPQYSTTAANNTTMDGVGTGEDVMTIPDINDLFRALGAALRSAFNDLQWFEYGDGDGAATVAYASATTFTVAGVDVTGVYHVGRKVRAVGSSTGTIYGFISNSAFSTNTTVTVAWISGSLSNEAITVSLSQLTATNDALPQTVAKTGTANTFTADQTIKSTSDGASGPVLTLQHDSASPAASDVVGTLTFLANDDGGSADSVAAINVDYNTVTAGAEDATLNLRTMRAGSRATRLSVAAGAYMAGATGGDPGAGKFNATEIQQNGVAVNAKIKYALYQHTAAAGSDGGSTTATAWTKRTLTETSDPDGIGSVSSSVVTVGAGTYIFRFSGIFGRNGSGSPKCRLRLRNTTGSTTIAQGTNVGTGGTPADVPSVGSGIATFAGSTNLELQYWASAAVTNVGLGNAASAGSGEVELFAWLEILKIA